MVANNIINSIGDTPMVALAGNDGAQIYAKLEYFNPGGSVKDRISLSMVQAGEEKGKIDSETTIIEPTSGNTGIGLAIVAASKGYRLQLVMPDSMSLERRGLLAGLGAELVLTPGNEGMGGAVKKAQELQEEYLKSFMPQQFDNPENPKIHYHTTGREIIANLGDIEPDFFVAGVGTGGTITGVGQALKAKFPKIKNIAIEPQKSQVLTGKDPAPHKIQGIGAGFIPKVLDFNIIDEIIPVSDQDAIDSAKLLSKQHGILTGISAGAAYFAAQEIASRYPGSKIVTVLPDTGERYLSTQLFQD
ncbi:cysteine synthase A [Natranaerobius thermophilus]|uniref:Cysteine synthase n=1 Tax=Natranaerobius thermophilus (strain ATCC BAA-1301 / DSM 18059 / JW/NM-WN-LF) TaxID=457570 RepID=B2A552_NATTJ|nr:cysteine synthase A [Natranaerobius thermophilus]ACB85294.1 cysteine synthase [Natranaerobius thermophilus JW/NM-WN-LF]